MREIFRTKSFKILIITVVVLALCTISSTAFGTNIISSAVGYITTGMQRVSATVTENNGKKSYSELLAENEELKKEIATLRTQLADYSDTKVENARLWKFYGLKKSDDSYDFVPSTVIRRDSQSKFYSFTIDRGTSDNINVNDPVVSENGLVGYVNSVSRNHSTVTTILSPDLSAGDFDVKSKDKGLISGDPEYSDKGLVTFKKLEENNKIKVGDQISTTGVGGVYPKNISIGKVKEIKYNDFDTSLYAVVEPYENVKTVSDVVVITSFKGQGEVSAKED